MKKLTTLICVLAAIAVTAQEQVKHTPVSDDPAFNNLSIRPAIAVDMGFAEGWGAGLGVDARYVNDNLPIQFRASWHQNFIGSQNINALNKPLMGLEAGAAFAFANTNPKKPLRVVLKSSESRGAYTTTTHITYINVDGTLNKRKLLRGGLFMHRNNWSAGGITDDVQITVNGGTPLMNGNSFATGLYAGIGAQRRNDLVINTEQYGQRRSSLFIQWYLDVLFAPSVNLGEWTDETGSVGPSGTTYDINKDSDAKAQNVGARIGLLWNTISASAKKPNGLYFKIETGVRPAMQKHSAFFLAYLGFVINSK